MKFSANLGKIFAITFGTAFFVNASAAERRLLVTVTCAPQFKPDEALFFITDNTETTLTRTLAIPGGAIGGSEWRFAAVYRGEADKITYKVVVVGEHGELLPIGPIEVLTTSLRSFEEADTLNPRIAELKSQLEQRKAELADVTKQLEAQAVPGDSNSPLIPKIENAQLKLAVLQSQQAALVAELEGRKLALGKTDNATPLGFQTRLSTLTTEIQTLASLASQAERTEKDRMPTAKSQLDEATAIVNATKTESLQALEYEFTKLQKLSPN